MPPTPPTPAGSPPSPPRAVGGKRRGMAKGTRLPGKAARASAVAALTVEGNSGVEIARQLGISRPTLYKYLALPDVKERIERLRETQKSLVTAGVTALSEKMVNRIESALTNGDAKELELTTRSALNLERVIASSSGETYANRGTNVTIQQNTQNVTNIDADLESMLRILYPDGVIDVTPQALNP